VGAAATSGRNKIVDVESSAEGQATWIRVHATRPAKFTVTRLDAPPRVVIDLAEGDLALRGAGSSWPVDSWAVQKVTAHASSHGGTSGVRIVVWLARASTYRVANEGDDLVVRLMARDRAPASGAAAAKAPAAKAPAAKADATKESSAGTARLAAAEKTATERRAAADRAALQAEQARRAANKAVRKRWRSSLRLRKAARKAEASAELWAERADSAEQELARVREEMGVQSREPAVAARRPIPVTLVAGPASSPAAPAVPRKQAPTPPAEPDDADDAGDADEPRPPKAAAKPAQRAAPPVATDYASPAVASYGETSGPITQQTVSQIQQRRRKVYRGRKIDLDLKDADIHNLMRLLADVGGVNIVVPDDVKATITVRLRDVPWDQAMEVILASKGLWYRREGGLIRVAPRKELDAEDQAESERLRAMAESEAPETQVFTLNYAVAGKVRDQLIPLLSPKGRIQVDDRTNSLIINDISGHRRRIIGLVTQLDYQTPQIQIEARIVEARTTFNREFGIQWGGSVNASAAGGNSTGLVFPNSVNVAGGADPGPSGGIVAPSDFAVNLPAAVGQGSGGALGISLGSVGGNFNLNLRLSALEDSGTVRIISAPRITTSNNIEASIKSGISIPVSVVSANGVQTQFVPADLLLRVVPAVSQRDCAVSMQVSVTKNEADFVNTGARGDPSILTKEAKTTILVADGQTAVIGGIFTRNTGLSYNKVPFFGDIPVLGWFFKIRRENDDRSEVLIFITPKITNRAFLRCQ
jgi:type IV pilus assembly protein PilQ